MSSASEFSGSTPMIDDGNIKYDDISSEGGSTPKKKSFERLEFIQLGRLEDDTCFCVSARDTFSYITARGPMDEKGIFQTTISDRGSLLQEKVPVNSSDLHFGAPYDFQSGDEFYLRTKSNTPHRYVAYFGSDPYEVNISRKVDKVNFDARNLLTGSSTMMVVNTTGRVLPFRIPGRGFHYITSDPASKKSFLVDPRVGDSKQLPCWGMIQQIIVGDESLLVVSESVDEGLLDIFIVRF